MCRLELSISFCMRLLFCCLIALILLGWKAGSGEKLPPKQSALELDSLPTRGQLIGELDSIYSSAVHADSTKAFFKSGAAQEAWMGRWQEMLYELGDSLHSYGLRWDGKVRVFIRTYFNAAGRIDYFLYSIKEAGPGYPGAKMRDSMRTVFRHFAATYALDSPIGATVVQCGPIILAPAD